MLDKATPEDIRLLSEKMETFRCTISLTEYRLPVPKIELLKLPETQRFIQNLFEREKLKCFFDIPDCSETVFLYTLTEDEGQTAALIIKTSIQKITARRTFMESEEFKDILKRYPGELIVNQWSSNNACRLCCTNDVLVEIALALMPEDSEKEGECESKAISHSKIKDRTKVETCKDPHTLQADNVPSEKVKDPPTLQASHSKAAKDQTKVETYEDPHTLQVDNDPFEKVKDLHTLQIDSGPSEKVKDPHTLEASNSKANVQTKLETYKDPDTLHVDNGPSEKLEFRSTTEKDKVKPVAQSCQSKQQITKTRSFEDLSNKYVLSVDVHQADILKLDVECIVNSTNENLVFSGGVAGAIAGAAGHTLEAEARQFIKKHGSLLVGKCFSTSAGNLPYKYVIHTTGPRWIDCKDKQKCAGDLRTAVMGCLELAEKLQVHSIAIPSVSAGIFGVPKGICAAQYRKAVENFQIQSTLQKSKLFLKKILFVDKDEGMCKVLKQEFSRDSKSQIRWPSSSGHCKTTTLSVSATSDERESIHQYKESLSTVSRGPPLFQTTLQQVRVCKICRGTVANAKRLLCGHHFCSDCIDQWFAYEPACPQCGKVVGQIIGDQPPGTMTVKKKETTHLPGYRQYGTIEIHYNIPSGKQTSEHPNPGVPYIGISRVGYLPDNKKGRLVAQLLRVAFDRRLVFTIGRSKTTGLENVVIWRDVHHKTSIDGGPERYGYPDDTYLNKVLEELAAVGITKES